VALVGLTASGVGGGNGTGAEWNAPGAETAGAQNRGRTAHGIETDRSDVVREIGAINAWLAEIEEPSRGSILALFRTAARQV